MRNVFRGIVIAMAAAASTALVAQTAQQTTQKPFEPTVGQAGKDVVWVPTPQPLVEKMLDMAKVTPKDFVVDLGSGDGRTVITAAKRGATALGIEFNPLMVTLSRKNAADAGVSAKATFQDQYEAAAHDPEHEARHAHRYQLLHHGRLGRGCGGDG